MAQYYLITDYLIPERTIQQNGEITYHITRRLVNTKLRTKPTKTRQKNLPSNFTLLSLEPNLQIQIIYLDIFGTGFQGYFLIDATNMKDAYAVGNAIRNALLLNDTVYNPDRHGYFLKELSRVPQPSWSAQELLAAMKMDNPSALELILKDFGNGILVNELDILATLVQELYSDLHLNEALAHLHQSLVLFDGTMPASYYEGHYVRERPEINEQIQYKIFLENKPKFEIAFVAAFKAIERFLQVNSVKKHEISKAINSLPYPNIKHDTLYKRRYEIFLGLEDKPTFEEVIRRFLVIRNTAAGHGNKKSPEEYYITEDTLYEIQHFVRHLAIIALRNIHPN